MVDAWLIALAYGLPLVGGGWMGVYLLRLLKGLDKEPKLGEKGFKGYRPGHIPAFWTGGDDA